MSLPTDLVRYFDQSTLTNKEKLVITLIADGMTNRQIGKLVGRTEQSVKNIVRLILLKLGFTDRLEVALWYEARRLGIVVDNSFVCQEMQKGASHAGVHPVPA